MSNVTIPNSFITETPANPTQVNANFSAIANIINGSLGDVNIDPAQPLQPSKVQGIALIQSNLLSFNYYNIIFNPFLIGLTSPLYVRQWVLNTNATLTLNDSTLTVGINSVHDANASDTWVMQQTIGTALNTTLFQSDLHLIPGQTYIVSMWVKTVSGSSSVYIAAQNATVYASGNTNLNSAGNTTYHTGSGSYQLIYSIFTVPANCQQVNIALVKPANTNDVAVSAAGLTIGTLPIPIAYNPHELQNGTTSPDLSIANFGLSDYIVSGLTASTSASLSTTIASGFAYLNGIKLAVASDGGHTYTASKDTYVDLNIYTLQFTYNAVSNGASAPALTANSIRIAKVISGASTISSVIQFAADSNGVLIYPTVPYQKLSSINNINNLGLSDYVVSGLTIPTSAGLSSISVAGVAYIKGYQINIASDGGHTYTASQDTYVDVDWNGVYHYSGVSNGASAPTLTANSIRIAKVVTSGSAITNVYTNIFDSNYVWIYPNNSVQKITPLQLAQMSYKCKAKLGSDGTTQSIPNTTTTTIAFATAVFDPNSNFNTSTHLYTCPVAGYYSISAVVAFQNSASGSASLIIEHNGIDDSQSAASLSGACNLPISNIIQCAAGDTLSMKVWQSSGSSQNIMSSGGTQTYMAVHFLSS